MKRDEMIKRTGERIDTLKVYVYRADQPEGYALLGELERFANDLTGTKYTMREAHAVNARLAERTLAFQDSYSYLGVAQ